MARINIRLVVLVALTAVVLSAPLTAARRHIGDTTRCVGEVAELLQRHEGRHRWAYDHKGGFRAVGSGYNLDENKDQRRKELERAGLDYDRVYNGDIGLNELEISGLLILDAKRALKRIEETEKRFRDLCCPVRAVFADIQHTRSKEEFPREDLDQVIEKATSEDYKSAADELERTKWCSEGRNRGRCRDNLDLVERGCPERKRHYVI